MSGTAATITDVTVRQMYDDLVPPLSIYYAPLLINPLVEVLDSSALDRGGVTSKTPFRGRITGDVQRLAADTELDVSKVGTKEDEKCSIIAGKALAEDIKLIWRFGKSILAETIPDAAVYWGEQYSKHIYAMLDGIFKDVSGATKGTLNDTTHKLDFSAYEMCQEVLAACDAKLGHQNNFLKYAVMNTDLKTALAMKTKVSAVPGSSIGIKAFENVMVYLAGNCVITIDDNIPNTYDETTKTYYSKAYIGKPGVIKFRNNRFQSFTSYTTKAGQTTTNAMISMFETSIRGVKCNIANCTVANDPDIDDLKKYNFWTSVVDYPKDIPLVEVKTKVNPDVVTPA